MNLSSGCIVEYSAKGTMPEIGAVLSNASGTVRLMLLNGKETNIPEKKILLSTKRAVVSTGNKEQCKQTLADINAKRNEIVSQIDLEEIRSILIDDPKAYTVEEIAEFLFSSDDDNSIAALLRKLSDDKLYFKNKNGLFTPATEDELKQAKELQAKKEQGEKEETELASALKNIAAGKQKGLPESLKNYFYLLKEYMADDENANLPKKLSNALIKADLASSRKLFNAMIRAEIINQDENLGLVKYKIPVNFSSEQLQEAEKLAKTDIRSLNRIDLTSLKVWAIDTPGCKDRDDAFSLETNTDGSTTLYVHIADPAEIIKSGEILDKEAMRRGTSVYMPDLRINMLPEVLSEDFLSLSEGNERLAITFKLTFNSECDIINFEIFESIIKLEKATDYDTANDLLASDTWLKSAYDFSEKLKNRRIKDGAVMLTRQPEPEITVIDGTIEIKFKDRDTLTAGMIAEFMIWTNHAAALWFREKEIPCLYRTQDGEETSIPEPCNTFDAVKFWQTLKTFKKTVVSQISGKHFSLGVIGYTQVTSPIRRYSDLLLHRQIKSILHGEAPQYSSESLSQTIMISDIATGKADSIMNERERYFMLKYIKQWKNELSKEQKDLFFDGVIVDNTGLTDVNFYCDFLCNFKHSKKPNFDTAIGQEILAKVTQIDPFDGVIRFDIHKKQVN